MEISLIPRKESLILSTIEVIDDLGIQGLTTKEIAKRQGVSEATLFRYYKTKNHLLLAVLDYFTQYDEDIFKSIKLKNLNPREAIEYYVRLYAIYYENYPAITSITQLFDVLQSDSELGEKINSIFDVRYKFIKGMVEKAQKEDLITTEADSDNLADLIISACNGLCLKWRLQKYNFSLREKTISTIKMLLDAFTYYR